MKNFILLVFFSVFQQNYGQEPTAFQIFDKKGNKSSFDKMVKSALKNEVVLFGEFHDNPIIHWLQLEFTREVYSKKELVLGAEMIETDNQAVVNKYLKGLINQKVMDSTARLWPNYKTDYKPLVDFAKDKKIDFIATNIPRKYASMVFKKGIESLETLSHDEKKLMAKLPIEFDIELPGYKAMLTMQGGKAGVNMPKAQAIKDATMASFILKNKKENHVFIHYNGSYHSDNYEGIGWYLKLSDAALPILTIATVSQKNVAALEKEHLNKADFIIVVDEDMTKTH